MKINLDVKTYFMQQISNNLLTGNRIEIAQENEADSSVSLTISNEGKEKYRQKLKELNGKFDDSTEDVILQKQKLFDEALSPEIDYNFWLGGERNKLQEQGVYIPINEKANNLLNAYAKIYDEIVAGYENGTREIYVVDDSCDTGYRKLTREEELSGLNDAYDKYAENLNFEIEHIPETMKIYEDIMAKMAKLAKKINGKPLETLQKLSESYEALKKEKIPENAYEKLKNAKSSFVDLYAKNLKGERNIQMLLKNIRIL